MLILIGVFFAGLVIFHLLEPLRPIHTSYKAGVTRKGYWADALSTIVVGPGLDGLTKLGALALILLIPVQWQAMHKLGWVGQFAVYFLVNDLGRYWLHRWYHEFDFLWRIHRVHHTIVEMDALSVFRMHILEAVIKNCVITLPFRLLGADHTVMIVYSAVDIIKGFWHHANLRTHIGPLNYVLNSAELHWWHHSVEAKGQRSNYGSILSIWDWLFKTAYWPKGQWPEKIGVEGMDHFPNDYVGQMLSIRHTDQQIYDSAPGKAALPTGDRPDDAPSPVTVPALPGGSLPMTT